MLQVVAGLTVVFVGYVLYEVYKTVSSQSTGTPQVKAPTPVPPAATPEPTAQAEPAADSVAAAPKPQKPAVEPKKSDAAMEEAKTLQLKDPSSGEASSAPTNYRFAKKWIKEAMVAEGLLEKVYKNAELDEAAGQKVREALEKFKALTKYHA